MNNFKIIFIILGLTFSMNLLANPTFSDDLLKRATSGDTSAQLELADVYVHGGVSRKMKLKRNFGQLNQLKAVM